MIVGRRGSGPMEQQQNGATYSSLNYPHHHLPNQPFSFESEVHKADIQVRLMALSSCYVQ
jgi:hypothetical protein